MKKYSNKIKVAIIEPVGGHGGMNYYDFCLAEGLVAAGAEVTVYTCDKTNIPKGLPFGVKLSFLKIWGHNPKILRAFRFFICLLKTMFDVREKKIELIHYHFFHYTKMEILCVLMARIFALKIVITAHDVESFAGKYSAQVAYRILSMANKVIAHNKVSRLELVNKVNMPKSMIAIIPHGHYLNSIPKNPSPSIALKKLSLTSNPVLLFFGQIKEVKGLELLLNALPPVIATFPNLKLLIAGKVWKDDFSKYKKIINENNLQNNVDIYIRYISDEDVATFYRAADIVILPYRRIYQSGVLLMAMSYGLPVLVSDLEGMTEIIQDNVNGFVFKTGDVKSLSMKLIDVLNDSGKLKLVASQGFKTVVKKHNWGMIGEKTIKLYREILI